MLGAAIRVRYGASLRFSLDQALHDDLSLRWSVEPYTSMVSGYGTGDTRLLSSLRENTHELNTSKGREVVPPFFVGFYVRRQSLFQGDSLPVKVFECKGAATSA